MFFLNMDQLDTNVGIELFNSLTQAVPTSLCDPVLQIGQTEFY